MEEEEDAQCGWVAHGVRPSWQWGWREGELVSDWVTAARFGMTGPWRIGPCREGERWLAQEGYLGYAKEKGRRGKWACN